ncbi:hypothetical protein HPB51_019459 [Rhipicephalus microplus]|uniref:Secreted protein n=1 Tax=Rhipicephalus microplus TaxID=6941 RepID=A0A9J6DVQ5_RHIMP|nr:hypothetical protein HPB51_019459 [Rhipicephalus microplus]
MSHHVPLLVQVLTGCLFSSTSSSAFCTGQLDLRPTFDAPFKLGTGIVAGDIFDTPVAPRLQPEHHLYCAHIRGMMTSPVQPASATPAAIKGMPIASSGSGHSNQAATMSPSVPLLVQVLTGCLFSSTGSSAFCTGQLDLGHTFDAPFKLGTGIVAGDIFDTPVAPRLQPEHHLYCAHLRGMMTIVIAREQNDDIETRKTRKSFCSRAITVVMPYQLAQAATLLRHDDVTSSARQRHASGYKREANCFKQH